MTAFRQTDVCIVHDFTNCFPRLCLTDLCIGECKYTGDSVLNKQSMSENGMCICVIVFPVM